ncbi:MAG TPA: methyltransferase domain-containing protein [Planctomycetota bacterium]|nr:methyltransferase domain-containing protein [Planctomycetota bacterium]
MPISTVDIVSKNVALDGSERLLILAPGPHGAEILPRVLETFAKHACTVLDSDKQRLSSATNCRRVRGQATKLPFVRHSFDAILSFEALYSIRPPWTVLAEFHRVLVPDGKLILLEPASHGLLSSLRDKISGPGKRIFSTAEIKYRLARGDWDIENIVEEPRVSEMPRSVYCVRAIKRENPAEPVPQYLTARDLLERRKARIPQGEELP